MATLKDQLAARPVSKRSQVTSVNLDNISLAQLRILRLICKQGVHGGRQPQCSASAIMRVALWVLFTQVTQYIPEVDDLRVTDDTETLELLNRVKKWMNHPSQ